MVLVTLSSAPSPLERKCTRFLLSIYRRIQICVPIYALLYEYTRAQRMNGLLCLVLEEAVFSVSQV